MEASSAYSPIAGPFICHLISFSLSVDGSLWREKRALRYRPSISRGLASSPATLTLSQLVPVLTGSKEEIYSATAMSQFAIASSAGRQECRNVVVMQHERHLVAANADESALAWGQEVYIHNADCAEVKLNYSTVSGLPFLPRGRSPRAVSSFDPRSFVRSQLVRS